MTRDAFPPSWTRLGRAMIPWLGFILLVFAPGPVAAQSSDSQEVAAVGTASDAEACLTCHRFPGLSTLDHETGELRLFFTSERYYAHAEGPHARLDCTQCHSPAEVEVIPHEDTTPVDCGQACHVPSSMGTLVEFTHALIAKDIEASVHDPDTMFGLEHEAPLLREGQSSCLFCHDQPMFRDLDLDIKSHRGVSPATRCATCHDEAYPIDAAYYIQHTAGRLQDARPVMQTAQVCATCHSDPALLEQMELSDAVSSYFRSFHGKASLLGSSDTATCVDCHRTETGNVHRMQSSEDEDSRTNKANLALTCRNAECHPNAVPDLSEAGVHLNINPLAHTPEYWVMAFFLVLTIGVMSIYFVLVMLELLNAALRRQSDEHRSLVALASAVMSHRRGRAMLRRLTPHERVQHWALAITFILLVITGLPLKFATVDWVSVISDLFGGVASTRRWHRVSGVLISITFFYHIGYLSWFAVLDLRRRRAEKPDQGLAKTMAMMVYESPMMLRPEDLRQFIQLWGYLLGLRKHRPAQGRFHFSQKFEYWAVFWGMMVIGSSGALLWANASVTGLFGGRALNFAFIVHSDEAFLALMYIFVVHFFAVMFSPTVFPLNPGALTGMMPVAEIAEGHAGHLLEVAERLGIQRPEAPPRPTGAAAVAAQVIRRGYALVLMTLLGALAWSSIGFLVHELKGADAVVAVGSLPLRLDESSLISASTGTGAGAARQEPYQRGPLAHYHVIPTWYSPDDGNSCAGSGCHQSLPHGERKESRAFLNMHSTFVDCQVCHVEQELQPTDLGWVSLDAARTARTVPAVLELSAALAEPPSEDLATRKQQDKKIREILTRAIADSGGDTELETWLLQLQTSRVGGPLHTLHMYEMQQGIYLHGHGEYGAKIGWSAGGTKGWTMDAEQSAAADALRADEGTMTETLRDAQVDLVHRGLERPEVKCSLCHTSEPGFMDFEGLGYAKARATALRSNIVARQSEAVERGETFYLPALLAPTPPAIEETTPAAGPDPDAGGGQ